MVGSISGGILKHGRFIMGNPSINGWFGSTPILGNLHICWSNLARNHRWGKLRILQTSAKLYNCCLCVISSHQWDQSQRYLASVAGEHAKPWKFTDRQASPKSQNISKSNWCFFPPLKSSFRKSWNQPFPGTFPGNSYRNYPIYSSPLFTRSASITCEHVDHSQPEVRFLGVLRSRRRKVKSPISTSGD